ncbi:hypothetical protein [Shewanella xiamenensis]|uniref:hypothetical protein n=1 Tax=Shewanella xiamenensis TaxID=332186 RepID=UPI00217DA1C1|nr:hypothetical protein [Shewanella xiamenensis]MCT8871583.1 hypothetical protein [Shewanella xiamenensis]UWH43578.1 hypothetical protein KXJ80_10240 [Shewanella xiamenensis]
MSHPIAAHHSATLLPVESQLLLHLSIACRLAQLPELMHCPTVIQRKNELEAYLQSHVCSYAFRERYHVTKLDDGPLKTTALNEVANIQVSRSGRVKLTRIAEPPAINITVSDRTISWLNRSAHHTSHHASQLMINKADSHV